MDPLAGEVIVSGELLLQNGAAIYYPIPSVRKAFICLDRLGHHKYPWYSTNQLLELHRQLKTGKTVTWFTRDGHQQITAITYPIAHEAGGIEEVTTSALTVLYPGEARELQVQKWQGRVNPRVCRFFEPDKDIMFEGHLGPIPNGQVRAMPGILFGGAIPMQNVIMLNQSAQIVSVPAGTVIGHATSMDYPDAPSVICNWGHLQQAEETIDEQQQVRQVYQMADKPQIRE